MVGCLTRSTEFPALDTFVNISSTLFLSAVSCTLFLFFTPASSHSQSGPDARFLETELSSAVSGHSAACEGFNTLNTQIRDGRISRNTARAEVERLLAEIRKEYFLAGGGEYPVNSWVFPLAGYDAKAVGGGRRHGYAARGYDFFSGNRHGGHPSYDIFIRDRNQDSLDDRSGKPVPVLSMTGGIVVALEREWEKGSRLRGGRYIWVYDPANDLLVYYAHNGDITVALGETVKPGDQLATVGRSGWNAAKRRSPTHLHLTVVRFREGKAEPLNIYRDLARAVSRTRGSTS